MSKKILIIDDSALMRRVISDIIKCGNCKRRPGGIRIYPPESDTLQCSYS